MIYVHIPFCKSFCTYCGFYSETSVCYDRYVEALLNEINCRKPEFEATRDVNTLYIGGGTPSMMPLPLLCRVVGALKEAFGVSASEEFTVELNPEDVVKRGEAYAEALLEMGVTRASMGVQSFDDGILRWMNRRHDAEMAVKAYRILERAGFRNISIDLIFGLPELLAGSQPGLLPRHREKDGYFPLLDEPLWRETILRALDISASGTLPSHISAYQLSVEPDSALERMAANGRCREASDESCARQYEILCEELFAAGYHHYEISNFALPGREAVHNSAYWRHVPYVGLGPGAHSLSILPDGRRRRSWNSPDLKLYLETFEASANNGIPDRERAPSSPNGSGGHERMVSRARGSETLSPEQMGIENIMLGLRTSRGCPLSQLRSACDKSCLDSAISSGRLIPVPDNSEPSVRKGDSATSYYRIPEKYFFISDNIISELLG